VDDPTVLKLSENSRKAHQKSSNKIPKTFPQSPTMNPNPSRPEHEQQKKIALNLLQKFLSVESFQLKSKNIKA
jgi:hypothetical protein